MRSLLAVLMTGMALFTPTVSKAEHDFYTCRVFVTASAPVFKVRLCTWYDYPYEPARVAHAMLAVKEGTKMTEPLSITVVVTFWEVLHGGIYGVYEPVTKTVFINADEIPLDDNYKFYYTFGHELTHAILDQRHVSWDQQHCQMKGEILDPLRGLIRSWNPEARFENILQLIMECQERE